MDEVDFFRRVRDLESRQGGGIGDIRPGVWQRIDEIENDAVLAGNCNAQGDDADRSFVFGVGIAAAFTILVTAGFLYYSVGDLIHDIAFSSPMLQIFGNLN